jgi:hypothetical protein
VIFLQSVVPIEQSSTRLSASVFSVMLAPRARRLRCGGARIPRSLQGQSWPARPGACSAPSGRRAYKQCAVAVGLTGKMTATIETDEFNAWAATVIERIGKYPAGAMTTMSRKKQTTRLLNGACGTCGYTVRITKKMA